MAIYIDDVNLINLVENYSFLYNKKEVNFKNKIAKDEAWKFISKCLKVEVHEAENRWAVLRHRYARERRNLKTMASNGEVNPNIWLHYNAMDFLDKFVTPRRSYVLPLAIESQSSDSDSMLIRPDNSNMEHVQIKLEEVDISELEASMPENVSVKDFHEEANPVKRRRFEGNESLSKTITGPLEHIVVPERQADEWDKYGQIFAQGLRAITDKNIRMEVIFDITRLLTLHRPENC